MEQIFLMLIAFAISLMCVGMYVLGLSHGRKIKSGAEVKLEPRKAILRTVTKHKEVKEAKAKQDGFSKQINDMFAYEGRVKKVAK